MNPDMPPIPLDTLLENVEGMRRLAHRLVRDPALAEDVAQDAVLVALSKGPRHGRNLRGWLNGIVRNVARDSQRSAGRRVRHEGEAPPRPQPPDPLSRTVQLAEQKRLLDAVEALAEPYRETVWKRYFQNRAPRVIARQAGVSVETVQTRLKRARAMLRAKLDSAHGGDRRQWALALAPLAASGSSWVLPALIGGALVTTKTKVGALVALILLATGGLWWIANSDLHPDGTDVSALPANATGEAGDEPEGGTLEGRKRAPAGESGATDPSAPRVTGRVVDEAEQLLTGVEIHVGLPGTEDVEAMRLVARSTKEGRFAFSAPEGALDLRVVASAPGRLDAVARVRPSESAPLVLRLPAVPTYVFRFLDGETDQPLAGVRCELVHVRGTLLWRRTFRSNPQGLVALPNPSADEMDRHLSVRISHPGYRPVLKLDRPARARGYGTDARPRDVYLRRAPRLVFEARDPKGRPVADVRIRAWAGSPGLSTAAPEWRPDTTRHWSMGHGQGVVLGDARTDEAGRVVFDAGPQELSWFAYASGDGLAGMTHGESTWKNKDSVVVIQMEATARLAGRVTDSAGHPVARARVECAPWYIVQRMRIGRGIPNPPDECSRLWWTMTDENGAYVLEDLSLSPAPAEQSVSAIRGDLGMAHARIQPATGPDETQRVNLVLSSEYETRVVRVVDGERAPVAGALVTFAYMMPGMLSDADGRTRLIRYPGVEGPFRAFKTGYRIGSSEDAGEDGVTTIVLTRGHALWGRVLDPDDKPHEAYVDVYAPEVADLAKAERRGEFLTSNHFGRTRAARGGHFRLEGLPPGPYFVRFWYGTKRAGKRHTVMGEMRVAGGEALELRLPESEPPATPGGIVEGSVADEDGRILTTYSLSLRGTDRPLKPALNGRRFLFEDVPPGEWRLQASAEQGVKQTELFVRVRPGETTRVEVVVGRSLTLRGRLVDESGQGVAGTIVRLYRESSTYSSGGEITDAAGRFEIKTLLAGRYRTRIRRHADEPPYCTTDSYFELQADPAEEMVIRALPAGTLTLSLEDDRFLPYSKEWFSSRYSTEGRSSAQAQVKVVTDTGETLRDFGLFRGRKTFDYPLAPGSYDLVVKTQKEGSFRTSFTVMARADTVVPVLLEK